jgi:hypothetical protein
VALEYTCGEKHVLREEYLSSSVEYSSVEEYTNGK